MGWHIVVTEEMRALGLSGNDLMVFALINGFSQDGQGCYYGSISYICETCGISKSTTMRILQDLTKRGFLIKKEIYENGIKSVSYKSGVKMTPGVVSKCNGGGVKMTPNNIIDINISPTEINNNKGKRFEFKKSLIEIGVHPEVAEDWMQVRKAKKASNTETAFKRIKSEIEKSGLSANECITIAVARSWQGFQAEWVANRRHQGTRVSVLDNNRMVAEELMRMAHMEETS